LILLLAQVPEDAGGCMDPQLLIRKSGCIIESCSQKNLVSLPILTARQQTRDLEGATHKLQIGLDIVHKLAAALLSRVCPTRPLPVAPANIASSSSLRVEGIPPGRKF
jgi:hypothetical protein